MSAINMPSTPVIPQEAALRVVKGSIASGVAAAIGGSIYGVMKAQPATMYAFQSGANTFVFAFPFFALREYVISPLMTSDRDVPSMHTKNVAASAISGTIVGGAMSAYLRGPKKFVSGSTTFGALCTTMQLLGNELRVLRVHMLAGRGNPSDVSIDSQPSTSPLKPESPSRAPSPATQSPPQISLPTAQASSLPDQIENSSSWLHRVGSYLSSLSPVKQISDKDYQEQLNNRRQHILEQLKQVETTIASEEAAQKKV